MEFYSPWFLLLLVVVAVAGIFEVSRRRTAGVRFSSLGVLKASPVSLRVRFRWLLKVLRYAALVLLIVAMARPRKGTELSSISTEGVAMEIVVDHSGSMGEKMSYEGEVFNRLEVVKRVVAEFVAGNDDDLDGGPGTEPGPAEAGLHPPGPGGGGSQWPGGGHPVIPLPP